MDDIRALLARQDMGATRRWSHTSPTPFRIRAVCGRPSRRCSTASSDAYAVVHTHADAIVSLTNNDRGGDVLAGVYGKDVIALDYRRPGFKISREVADAIAAHPQARALLLSKHGTITWGATVREAYEATIELITRAEDAITERTRGRRAFGGPRVPVLPAPARRAGRSTCYRRLLAALARAALV